MHFRVLPVRLPRAHTKTFQHNTEQANRRRGLDYTLINIQVIRHLHRELLQKPDKSLNFSSIYSNPVYCQSHTR